MAEVVQMSWKESDRYAVIVQVIERTMGQSDAGRWLNISVRQVKRLVRAIRQDAAQGAVSKRRGGSQQPAHRSAGSGPVCRPGARTLRRLWPHLGL